MFLDGDEKALRAYYTGGRDPRVLPISNDWGWPDPPPIPPATTGDK